MQRQLKIQIAGLVLTGIIYGMFAGSATAAADYPPTTVTLLMDEATFFNPLGVCLTSRLVVEKTYRYDEQRQMIWASLQVAPKLTIAPSHVQPGLFVQWMPAAFLQLGLDYDFYQYFGYYGLHSFTDSDADFGADAITDIRSDATTGRAHRINGRIVLRSQFGPLVIRLQGDGFGYWFDGPGPWYYDFEHDALLKDGDLLIKAQAQVLLEVWRSGQKARLLAGPTYYFQYAHRADHQRQRVGVAALWIARDELGFFIRPRLFLTLGVNLQGPTREDELTAMFGFGGDVLLWGKP